MTRVMFSSRYYQLEFKHNYGITSSIVYYSGDNENLLTFLGDIPQLMFSFAFIMKLVNIPCISQMLDAVVSVYVRALDVGILCFTNSFWHWCRITLDQQCCMSWRDFQFTHWGCPHFSLILVQRFQKKH